MAKASVRRVRGKRGCMSGKVFVSYARSNGEFALALAKDLRAAGVSVRIEQLDIMAGDQWDRAVEEVLESC